MNNHSQTITEAEYQSLPQCIQRKFFSPLERLRIHEASSIATVDRRPATSAGGVECCSSTIITTTTAYSDRAHKPSEREQSCAVTSAEGARWFLSLPEKIKRQTFSREEQLLLTARSEALLSGTRSTTTVSTARASSRSPSHTDTVSTHGSFFLDSDVDELAEKARNSLHTTHIAAAPPPDILRHASTPRPSTSSRRPSRRSMSFSAASLPRPSLSLSSPVPQLPSLPPFFNINPIKGRSRSNSATSTKPSHKAFPGPIIDPQAAQYIAEPEARLKLRQALASPEKFDEFVEYGLPSAGPTQRPSTSSNRPTRTSLSIAAESARTGAMSVPVTPLTTTKSNSNTGRADYDVIQFMSRPDDVISFLDAPDSQRISYASTTESEAAFLYSSDDEEERILETPVHMASDDESTHTCREECHEAEIPRRVSVSSDETSGPTTPGLDAEPVFQSQVVQTHSDEDWPLPSPPVYSTVGAWRQALHEADATSRSDAKAWDRLLGEDDMPGKPGTREMTLRVTLTRPDLRAPEDEIYAFSSIVPQQSAGRARRPTINARMKGLVARKTSMPNLMMAATGSPASEQEDPFKLAHLPALIDDESGRNGVFAVQARRKEVLGRMLRGVGLRR